MDSMLDDFFAFLSSVPDVVWSGIIASFLTFIGVMLSNGSSTKRLKIQLRHDAQEKSKERISILRRDVYLKAVEELNRVGMKLVSFAQADFVSSNPADDLQDFFASASKLQLIAEPKTSLLVGELVASYSKLSMRLLVSLAPLNNVKINIGVYDRGYEVAAAEISRILEKQRLLVESAQGEQKQMDLLNAAFDFSSAQAKTNADLRAAAWGEYRILHVEYVKLLMQELKVIGAQQAPLMTEIRRDLGLTEEIEILQEHLNSQLKEVEEIVSESLDSILKAK